MKNSLLIAVFLLCAGMLCAQTTINASAARMYDSAVNDPAQLGILYPNGFEVGSYSKNYATVTFLYFDISSLTPAEVQSSSFSINVKLISTISTPNNLNIDYVGTFSDTSNSLTRYLTPPIETFSNVLTYSAVSGITYDFDVSSISNHSTTGGFAAFRFYQTGYLLGDSANKIYNFSSLLADSKLTITPIPEPSAVVLYASLCAGIFTLYFRRRHR